MPVDAPKGGFRSVRAAWYRGEGVADWTDDNFGDGPMNRALLPALFPGLRDDVPDPSHCLLGIGSLLGLWHELAAIPPGARLLVFGSGFQYGEPRPLPSGSRVFCVRGRLSAETLGLPAESGVADPAVLLPRFFPRDREARPGRRGRFHKWNYGRRRSPPRGPRRSHTRRSASRGVRGSPGAPGWARTAPVSRCMPRAPAARSMASCAGSGRASGSRPTRSTWRSPRTPTASRGARSAGSSSGRTTSRCSASRGARRASSSPTGPSSRRRRRRSCAAPPTCAPSSTAVERRARIAYVTAGDPRDRHSWSGTVHYMARALATHVGEVVPLGPLWTPTLPVRRIGARMVHSLTGRRYAYKHSISLAKAYARRAQQLLARDRSISSSRRPAPRS